MGALVAGKWVNQESGAASSGGHFIRAQAAFRDQISADSSARYQPQSGRYHLYVSLACPWAHRTLIMRALKRLDGLVGVSVVAPLMLDQGWQFEGPYVDQLFGSRYLHELYTRAQPDYSGRVTVPVLWDQHTHTIVNNESSAILRIFDGAFDALGARPDSYYPQELRAEIDAVNERVYNHVNNGVYKAGFATTQDAYEQAFEALFSTLDWLDERLTGNDYLVGNRLTEADIRLFTTLLRFDLVYYAHFKCNLKRIGDYPALRAFRRRIYDVPGVSQTVDIDQIKTHYFGSHRHINPTGIVPKGPRDWL
jgi:putative glutathione S-transferase